MAKQYNSSSINLYNNTTVPVESMVDETEILRQKKQIERLTLAIAKKTEEQMELDIIKEASKRVTQIVPDKFTMLDPSCQIRGRPIYSIGAIPVIDKEMEIRSMLDQSKLAKYAPNLMYKLYNFWHFGPYDTLYFWTVDMMPGDGKWRILALSKPPRKTSRCVKRAWGSKEYIIEPAHQMSVDDMFTNKLEVVKGKAAIILTCTYLGPVPLDLYVSLQKQKGFESYVK